MRKLALFARKKGRAESSGKMSDIADTGREGEPDRSGERKSSSSGSSGVPKMAEGRIVRGTRREKPFVGVHWLG